ncbi:MAG: hypothetical protein KDD82_00885, partial [Planctomycetes bacterium]|nr:hypothetical protein [Planctomycetota bacterium]
LASFSQGYANQLYGYQDRLRAGEDARPPRGPALSSYVGQHLIVPSLGVGGGPDVLLLGEHTETAQASVAEPVVLAWREVHGSALKLVVVGHSFGGLSALRLTKKLRARGVAVQQLLTLDARTLPGLYGLFVTPPGVGAHHNYFQRSLWLPGYPIEGAQDHRLRGVRHTRMPAQREVRERFSAMLSAP